MAKWANDGVMDAALDEIALGTNIVVCSAQPATRAEALSYALANASVTPGDGNGDFTIANGDSSGRKVTMTAQSGVTIDSSGTATHIAIIDGSSLWYVTTCTSQALVSGGTVDIPAWKVEIADPT